MRTFDIRAKQSELSQYWSALNYTNNVIDPQITGTGVSGMVFEASVSPVIDNRNIVSDSDYSILLDSNPATVTLDFALSDYQLSMLAYPKYSDLDLVTFTADGFNDVLGVRLHENGIAVLSWPVNGEIVEQSIMYDEVISYVVFSVNAGAATLIINGSSTTISGDVITTTELIFGGGSGQCLIDKVAFSTTGSIPPAREYARLFRSNRLDLVPRPTGESSFVYLADISKPVVDVLGSDRFEYDNGYYYASVRNAYDTGLFSVERKSAFAIEYSVDRGETWATLPTKLHLETVYPDIIFRHTSESDHNYSIEVKNTYVLSLALASHDVTFDGPVYLPSDIGRGYYDAEAGYFGKSSIAVANNAAGTIGSLELLAAVNNTSIPLVATDSATNMTTYVNGEPRALITLKPDQIYHIVVVFETPQTAVVVNTNNDIDIFLVGLGASNVQYTQSDAYYLFNSFAGNTLISALEDIASVSDGIHPESENSEAGIVYDLQWNG